MLPTPSSSSATLVPPVGANTPPAWPGEAAYQAATSSGSGQQQLAISNGVLLAAVIFLFMVVVFVFLLYLYAKRYLGANPLLAPGTPSSRFVFVAASPLPQRGLPAAALRSLPVTVYGSATAAAASPGKERERLECAVCLSEVADGEKVRTLPKCAHGFHVECIDMWFHSHDTCPLCRAPVAADLGALPREEPIEFPVFPTNVLFWGTHDDVTNAGLAAPPPPTLPPPFAGTSSTSSSASGRRKENLVIDIPTRGVAINTPPMNSPLPASRMPGTADDMRSPVSARLRSIRRLLSLGKQAVVGTSYSPRAAAAGGDIEQGVAGAEAARPPKTPKTPPSAN
ncbi:hypothetical protein SEVIR_4G040200v4 [Setaria viridis]|uniref:RING-type E3 ubiquitin transferase n=1 Tax=Setaria viridis TaxID=4556 RepID=A0A4U6UWQ9_SETVI|nr:E3 ubiquitin-protein ligase EL5-like [Setaria viridis]TKW19744.1 hypothetical protein SEVIR_4G040200v2 [Setaria viridis]